MTESEGAAHDEPVEKKPKKPKKEKAPDMRVLRVRWDLHDLPTSQHRAGLAGLALAVQFLQRKPDRKGTCAVEGLDATGLTLVVDREGMQSLFDDLYDASWEERAESSKRQNEEPKRVEEREVQDKKTGKPRRQKLYVYPVVVPKGSLIDEWDSGTAAKLWLKLWRDFVWSTLRPRDKQRKPYQERAAGNPVTLATNTWSDLADDPKATVPLSGTYSLGAESASAENVDFTDRADHRFLLQFWNLVAPVYVPAVEKRDGTPEFQGYVVPMPDVATLDAFVDTWDRIARARGTEQFRHLPREALVELPGEAGLDLIRRTDEIIGARQGARATRLYLSAVDVFHIERAGDNVRLRAVARILPERAQVDEYARVRRAGYWSATFRRQRVMNVLERAPWWNAFGRIAATRPIELTFENQRFRHDCRMALTEVEMKEVQESEETLEHVVYKRVQSYVLGRTERKYQLTWDKVKGNPAKEKDYREKREKIGREAFLAVRSRTGSDFVTYFTSTICSIPQYTTEAKYIELARALLTPQETEKVRSLTLLALSALS
jgi:CRISPR-associated protein Cmx8